jgi:hypothetical protein
MHTDELSKTPNPTGLGMRGGDQPSAPTGSFTSTGWQ